MKYYNLLKYDLTNNLKKHVFRALAILLISIFFFISFYTDMLHVFWQKDTVAANLENLKRAGLSISDGMLYLTGGILPVSDFSEAADVRYPFKWIVVNLLVLYFTSEYARNDLTQGGLQVFIRAENKQMWWLSKCIWNFVTVCTCFGVLFLSWIFLMICCRFAFNGQINTMCFQSSFNTSPAVTHIVVGQALIVFYILPTVACASISMVQMTLTMYIQPVYAYLISCIYYILGMFAVHPLFLTNYSMSVRSSVMGFYRFTPGTGLCLCAVFMICSIVIGMVQVNRMDIIDSLHMHRSRGYL